MKKKFTYEHQLVFYFGVGLGIRFEKGYKRETIFILFPFFSWGINQMETN